MCLSRIRAAMTPRLASVAVVALNAAVMTMADTRASEPAAEHDPGFAGYWLNEEVDPVLDAVMADDASHGGPSPVRTAAPFPRFSGCTATLTSIAPEKDIARMISAVPSDEPSSTTMISK